ncbi:hypothetical protein HOY82DRAFT_547615 [Tuber indicum]|nr:hypothetical protein HOY82DRAFT_547615 [Tuber indicum]
MCALIELSLDEVVDLRKRVMGAGVTGGHLLGRLRFDDLKEILGIASFSKRMELWNEVLRLRGGFAPDGGGITESSPCLPMPVPVVDSLEGDIDADTPTHTGRGKPLAKWGKGKKKVVVVGLVSPSMASAQASVTPKQRWEGNGEGASPGLGSLDRTPGTTSTTIATATPTRNIKHKGEVKRLPSPTTSIASTPRPTGNQQQQQPEVKRQESPDIITTSTPAPATTTTTKTPKQKAKEKAKVSTPSVPAIVKTPLAQGTPISNTNPWAPPPPASDPFYSPIWNDVHPDGTPAKFHSSAMRLPPPLPLPPKPKPTSTATTTKHEARKKGRSASTTPATTTNTTTTRSIPTATVARPQPFLTPAPPKRKRSSSAASATIGWTTDARKRQKLSGRSFLKFGSGGGDDELSSGGSSPVERGGLRREKGIIVDRESAEGGTAGKAHKCCGRGFCFGCLDLEGEEDDLI